MQMLMLMFQKYALEFIHATLRDTQTAGRLQVTRNFLRHTNNYYRF